MTERLTNYMRETILQRILEYRFKEQEARLDNAEGALAKTIYEIVFSQKERDLMASLPKGWLEEGYAVNVEIAGQWERIKFASGTTLRFPHSKRERNCLASFEANSEIAITWHGLEARNSELRKQKIEASKAANAVLNDVTTVGALLKRWPEVEPFLSREKPKQENVPAFPIDQLNAMLLLPKEESATQ